MKLVETTGYVYGTTTVFDFILICLRVRLENMPVLRQISDSVLQSLLVASRRCVSQSQSISIAIVTTA